MTVLGYTDTVVEGTTVTFQCPVGLVLERHSSSTCMENGKWEPVLYEVNCTGINMHQFGAMI